MRNWINLFENVRKMEPRDYSVYSGTTIDNAPMNDHFSIMGDDVSGLSTEEAKAYLDQHPNGTIHNDVFETDAFITMDRNGNYLFYDPVKDAVEPWDWKEVETIFDVSDPHDAKAINDWWYHDGAQMEVSNGGFTWWSDIRSGKYSTPKPQIENKTVD